MHYFSNKFSKIANRQALGLFAPISSFIFDFGDLKLRDLPKLIMTTLIFKKISYDVISVTSSLLRYRKASPNWRHKIFFSILGSSQSKFLAMPVITMNNSSFLKINKVLKEQLNVRKYRTIWKLLIEIFFLFTQIICIWEAFRSNMNRIINNFIIIRTKNCFGLFNHSFCFYISCMDY